MDMDLYEQDRVAESIVALFPDARILDRRATPSSGYRAVHVLAQVKGFPVEIQIRTLFQDLWAQAFELFADRVGRGIRYGEALDAPDLEDIRRALIELAGSASRFEEDETRIHRLEDLPTPEPLPVHLEASPAEVDEHERQVALHRRFREQRDLADIARGEALRSLEVVVDFITRGWTEL